MKTFLKWLQEDKTMGNYVCIDATDQSNMFKTLGLKQPTTGVAPPNKDYHCTLMYSKDSNVLPHKILSDLENIFPNAIIADVIGFDCFDSLPEAGVRDEAKSCIVMKLNSPVLVNIHNWLKTQRMSHSYDEFRPHVTLRYNMSVEEAHKYKSKLDVALQKSPRSVILSGYKSDKIDTNYV